MLVHYVRVYVVWWYIISECMLCSYIMIECVLCWYIMLECMLCWYIMLELCCAGTLC